MSCSKLRRDITLKELVLPDNPITVTDLHQVGVGAQARGVCLKEVVPALAISLSLPQVVVGRHIDREVLKLRVITLVLYLKVCRVTGMMQLVMNLRLVAHPDRGGLTVHGLHRNAKFAHNLLDLQKMLIVSNLITTGLVQMVVHQSELK